MNKKGIFQIELKHIEIITDLSYMLSGCKSLLSISNIEKMKTDNVTKYEQYAF